MKLLKENIKNYISYLKKQVSKLEKTWNIKPSDEKLLKDIGLDLEKIVERIDKG